MQLTHEPIIRQAVLPLRISSRAVLSGIELPHNIFGQDNETIASRYLDATCPDHIRFVFNVGLGDRRSEPRFWNTEILALSQHDHIRDGAPPVNSVLHPKFTIRHAIAEILGARESFNRAEIGIQWSLSSNLLTDLIRANTLKQTGARMLRPDLEQFLLSRWSGNRE
jgi:hypothetical protein